MKFDKEFKEAIINLPESEKDKLLFRLLKKDLTLVNRLAFELLSEKSADQRRNELAEKIEKEIYSITENYYTPGYAMMELRYISGMITEHLKITKDKFGEISLNCLMLSKFIELNKERIENARPPRKKHKLCIYIIARAFKILLLKKAIHEDFHLDLEEYIAELHTNIIESHSLMKTAINNGLDVNWFLPDNIPDEIVQIHKEIRQNGFLK